MPILESHRIRPRSILRKMVITLILSLHVFLGLLTFIIVYCHISFVPPPQCVLVLRVTTCLENQEMSGNLKPGREMSGNLLTVRELTGNKPCHGKRYQKLVVASCIFAFSQVCSSISYKNCTYLFVHYILILSFVA